MDECRLDWKKVFKEILGDKSGISDVKITSSEQCKSELSCGVSNSGIRKSDESHSSDTLQLKHNFKNDRTGNKLSKSNVHLFEESNTAPIVAHARVKQSCSENVKVPEWNTVFKTILTKNSTSNERELKDIGCAMKKSDTLQRHHVPYQNKKDYSKKRSHSEPKFEKSFASQKQYVAIHGKKHYLKKKSNSVSKTEMAEELEQVREIFASSRRLLKPECFSINFNDLAGTGVDIFKCRKTTTLSVKSKNEMESNYSSDEYVKPNIPEGWVAKMKPLTSSDILSAPSIPFTEPKWDDDLFL